MAQFKTVYDLMGDAAKGKFFRGKSMSESAVDEMEHVDCEFEEFKSLGLVEKNILAGISMPDNFTVKKSEGKVDILEIGMTTLAKAVSEHGGVTDLTHTAVKKIDPFRVYGDWKLEYEHGSIMYPWHKGIKADRDKGVMGRISAQFPHLNSTESSGFTRTLLTHMLAQKTDMTHVFMKGYLIMMDLNTSVVFRRTIRRATAKRDNFYPNKSNDHRMGLVGAARIVVDADGFSAEELESLDMMCQEYPTVKYCEDNIYNTCNMEADRLAITSSREIPRAQGRIPTPLEFYRLMTSIACKLDAVEDMFTAFKLMRGRMAHIRDVYRSSDDRKYSSGVPLSTCYSRCLGGGTVHKKVCATYPAYMCSSVGLVADVLLGRCYEVAASMLIENLGGLGDMMCSGGARASGQYNGLLREYGLSTKDATKNELMLAWEGIGAIEYKWSPTLTWKPYIVKLTDEIRGGNDVEMPQLCYEIAHMFHVDNAWGAIRGYKGITGAGLAEHTDIGEGARKMKDERLRYAAAFSWAMGVRRQRPKIFVNSYGMKEVAVSTNERKFLRSAIGGYKFTNLSYTLEEDYEGREDWLENAATELFRSTIDGTRCSVIMSTAGEWHYSETKESKTEGIAESLMQKQKSDNVDEEIQRMTTGKLIEPTSNGAGDLFSKMSKTRSVVHTPKVKLSGGSLPEVREGETSFKTIPVPGDGKCGIHAVVASMKEAGMLRMGEEKLVFDNFDGQFNGQTFHDAQTIAQGLNEIGIGLRLYDNIPEKGVRVTDYGDVKENGIAIYRSGNHFEGVVEGLGDTRTVIAKEGGQLSNVQQVDALKEMRRFFE
ncbi:putative protease [Colletotrichum gloeosporioides chrysovirus 1]|uniref:Protease n=1 Tax=Colletotrichum gloeosporioides chrysovirus 1 TaxID=1766766 RepID=A0A0U4BBX7_9VIRU|nr:putative protease [Colletotrichum gloeosporioides chrysovirus 1]ALW95410.1 putative protease [Colletotrichum gloeosporioides chrysovirus 1]